LISESQLRPVVAGNDGLSGFLYLNDPNFMHTGNRNVNETDVVRLIPEDIKYGKLNFFLFKKSRNADFPDRDHDVTSIKKISDTVYEVCINDPDKEVLFGYNNLHDGFGVGIKGTALGGMNGPNIMGQGIDSLQIQDNSSIEKYKVLSFNPFLYGAEIFIYDKKDRNQNSKVLTFKILYQFPKPKLQIITTDRAIIKKKKKNPGFIYADPERKDTNSPSIFNKQSNTILFVFEHFEERYRFGDLDNLMYKLDDAQDWALTSLAHTPSILLENIPVGRHILYVKYPAEKASILNYAFEIKPDWRDALIWRILLVVLSTTLVLGLFFGIRLKRAKANEQKTRLELQAIQAQLNPHFMFNALGSIQYLVHSDDKQSADLYLTEFSNLLRNSLYNNEKEMVPLSVELQTLDSYIRLEKLRFHFKYLKSIDENIESDNVSIPTLLIQPLIENAIKHGIASLGEDGLIEFVISRQKNDLIIEIKDNGRGFNEHASFKGLGLKLVKERINVLKKQGAYIQLSFQSNEKNQHVARVVFEDWV
jgi:hypothetical protein